MTESMKKDLARLEQIPEEIISCETDLHWLRQDNPDMSERDLQIDENFLRRKIVSLKSELIEIKGWFKRNAPQYLTPRKRGQR